MLSLSTVQFGALSILRQFPKTRGPGEPDYIGALNDPLNPFNPLNPNEPSVRVGCQSQLVQPMRSRRAGRPVTTAKNVEPEFVPAIGLVVLDPDVVAAAGEGREVERGFVRGPVVDD